MAFQSDSGVIKTFNVGLFVSMCLAFLLGIVTLYSASKGSGTTLYKTQLVWFGLGLLVTSILVFVDSHFLERLAYPFYGVCMVLLTMVLFIGRVGGGSQRWIDLKVFHLQPSEIAKLAIVFTLANIFQTIKRLLLTL